jgi:hypothetical protein
MKNDERTLWTIDELCAQVAEALSVGYAGIPSGRVRDVPDLRTIRYYTTLGLLDRPAAMCGRKALYGSRHLLQLVAIKHLQARGHSLAAVSERVLGVSDRALRRIVEPSGAKRDPAPSATRGGAFRRLPATISDADSHGRALAQSPHPARSSEPTGSIFQTIPLGEGLMLSLPVRRRVDGDDLRSIHAAAASLIEVLKLRGLIDPDIDNESRKPGGAR